MRVYKNEDIYLYNEDCLKVLRGMEDSSVDMIITSPPYAERRKSTYGGINSKEYLEWFKPIAVELKRVLKPTGSFFLNMKSHCVDGERDLYVMKLVIMLREEVGFRFVDEFTWTKLGVPGKFNGRFKNAFEPVYHFAKAKGFTHNPYAVAHEATDVSKSRYKRKACGETLNGSGFAGMRKEIKNNLALPSNHLHIPQKSNQHTIESKHPAVFPVELVDFFVKAFSNEGDIILDIFSGSGTTGVSCKKNKRAYIGCEINEEYHNLCIERLSK